MKKLCIYYMKHMKVVIDDLAAIVECDRWLYRYETTSDLTGWKRVAFFTMPIFCRLSLRHFLRADGDGTVVRASGVPVSSNALQS